MIQLEDIRQSVMGTFQTAQAGVYPSMLVNYPNIIVVDIEHQLDPFISVDLEFRDISRAAMGEREIFGHGALIVYYYFQDNTGTSAALQYADFLNANIAMQEINSVAYQAVQSIDIRTFPGWAGKMNTIIFDVVKSSC